MTEVPNVLGSILKAMKLKNWWKQDMYSYIYFTDRLSNNSNYEFHEPFTNFLIQLCTLMNTVLVQNALH
jgi:hypothetical protein